MASMPGFSPLNFNYGIDPNLLNLSSGATGLSGGLPIGGGAVGGAAPSVAPGNLFSNLFGDGGIFSRQGMFGGTDAKTGQSIGGWAPTALGVGQAIMGGIQGRQAMGLAQDQFKEAKRQFDLNFNAQRQTINTQLEDRQRARVASNPGAYEDTETYLRKNRV